MAVNRGLTLFVLLLYCWQEAELQPINITSGSTTEMPLKPKSQDDIPGVFDEILVQEMLDPNKSSGPGKYKAATTSFTKLFKEKNAGADENYQIGSPELPNYRELSDNSPFSLGSEDKVLNNEPNADDSYQAGGPEGYRQSQLPFRGQDRISNNGKNVPKNDRYEHLSVMDKIFQNTGKSSGNSFR
uniref:Sperm acrosome associated 7 n=1 Tax=Rousettus aegyptiacus TaxID=9407 RepID=A0A7J8DZS3_ROUAE|nr:sperm acrosome associated 7 [Rousettus aegyptiacus]